MKTRRKVASKEVKASAAQARRKVIAKAHGFVRAIGMLEQKLPTPQHEQAAVDEAIFAAFRLDGVALLDAPDWRGLIEERIQESLESGDGNFFIRLGKAVNQSSSARVVYDKLDVLLTGAWQPDRKGKFGLCDFSDEALADFCALALDKEDLTVEAICKRRQRLGLRKAKNISVTQVKKAGGKMVFTYANSVDKSTH